LDLRLFDKPGQFSGQEVDWHEWKFKLQTWLALVDPQFEELLRHAETMDNVPDQAGALEIADDLV
jgi:hypothetical protein